jgi:hypothetical protein
MLSVVRLNVVMLSIVRLNVVMLSVVAHEKPLQDGLRFVGNAGSLTCSARVGSGLIWEY